MQEDGLAGQIAAMWQDSRRLRVMLRSAWMRERQIRRELLRRHAQKGVFAGLAVLFGGFAWSFENEVGTWVRPIIGGWALVGGTILFVGHFRRRHKTHLEVAGLVMMGVWDLAISLFFLWLLVNYWREHGLAETFQWPWDLDPFPRDHVVAYPVVIYFAIASMIWLTHLRAVLHERRHASLDVMLREALERDDSLIPLQPLPDAYNLASAPGAPPPPTPADGGASEDA